MEIVDVAGRREKERSCCSLMFFYGDDSSRECAGILYHHLLNRLHDRPHLDISWWRLEHLGDTHLIWRAAEAAMHADVLLLAVPRPWEPTRSIGEWFDMWVERRREVHGLLAYFKPALGLDQEQEEKVVAWLRARAQRAGMDFLSYGGSTLAEMSRRMETHSLGPSLLGNSETSFWVNPVPHGGINE